MAALSIEINPHKHTNTHRENTSGKKIRNLPICCHVPFATPISPLHTHTRTHKYVLRKWAEDIAWQTKGIVNTWAFLQLIHRMPSAHFSWLFHFPRILRPTNPSSSVFQVEISTIPVQLMARIRPLLSVRLVCLFNCFLFASISLSCLPNKDLTRLQ